MKTAAALGTLLKLHALVPLVLLLAFALRVFHLGANAIWWDESLSLYRATRDIQTILANTIQIQTILTTDLQPPFYFLILHCLIAAFGTSEFALRFLSVIANVATVALLYVLGRRWFSPSVGLYAAFLGALSPFWVWYAQEARPYALVLFWSLLAVYALARILPLLSHTGEGTRVGVWRWTYIFSTIAALYTNYYAVFLFPFHAVYIFLQTHSLKKTLLPALPTLSAIFLLPIIARGAAGNVNSGPSFVPLDIILRDFVHSFSVGITFDAAQAIWFDAVLVLLFLIGVVSSKFNSQNSKFRISNFDFQILSFLLLPTLVIFALSFIRPLYQNSRYLIAWSPAWYLGIALGINFFSRLSRPIAFLWQAFAVIMFLVPIFISLNNLYFNAHFAKDDHRAWSESLRERVRAEDFLILNSPHTEELYNYYAGGVVRYITLPLLSTDRAYKDDPNQTAVRDALRGNPRVWYLAMHVPFDDPDARIERLLNENGVALDRTQFRGSSTSISLSLYSLSLPTVTLDQISNRTNYLFDSRLRLLGWGAPKEIKPGTRGVIKLFWQLDEPAGEDYGVSLRALDAAGGRIAQWDAVPLGNVSGSSSWAMGKIIVDAHDLPIAAGIEPGFYRVQIQVYHSATGNGIGDAIILGDVTVR